MDTVIFIEFDNQSSCFVGSAVGQHLSVYTAAGKTAAMRHRMGFIREDQRDIPACLEVCTVLTHGNAGIDPGFAFEFVFENKTRCADGIDDFLFCGFVSEDVQSAEGYIIGISRLLTEGDIQVFDAGAAGKKKNRCENRHEHYGIFHDFLSLFRFIGSGCVVDGSAVFAEEDFFAEKSEETVGKDSFRRGVAHIVKAGSQSDKCLRFSQGFQRN